MTHYVDFQNAAPYFEGADGAAPVDETASHGDSL
jgi:hypothetical protein